MEDKLAWFNEVERLIDVLGIINTRIDKEEGYKVEKEPSSMKWNNEEFT